MKSRRSHAASQREGAATTSSHWPWSEPAATGLPSSAANTRPGIARTGVIKAP